MSLRLEASNETAGRASLPYEVSIRHAIASLVRLLPSLLTLTNLACGLLSIVMAAEGEPSMAAVLIMFGAIVDRYDGWLARKLGAESRLGKELDSLADVVTFGVAPTLLVHRYLDLGSYGLLGCMPLLVYSLSGATRLARYNCRERADFFEGVPITVCGFLVAGGVLLQAGKSELVGVLLISACLMLSKIRIKKV